jgi:hypothetical protein
MHVRSTTISNIAVSALMAFALAFVLFAQDRTNIWHTDPTVDLPEMANSVDDIGAHQVVAPLPAPEPPATPPIDGMLALSFLVSLAVAARRVMYAASPTAQGYSVPLYWLLANPQTAPPARA